MDLSIKVFEKRLDWNHIRKSPLFFWHAPRDLEKFEKEEREMKNTAYHQTMLLKNEFPGQFAQKKPILKNVALKSTFLRPRSLIYNTALKFNDERYKAIKNKRRPLKIDKLYTGECDFPFRLKIVGAENLQEVFRHYENECYYNGK
jgi:hypothetical protein